MQSIQRTAAAEPHPRRRARSHLPSVLSEGRRLPEALTRLRGGTFSPTVGRAAFTDGQSAHIDLIRLTPSIDAYSLDYLGASPDYLARYRPEPWATAPNAAIRSAERQVVWILAHSYPTLDVTTLSGLLRDQGAAIGRADLPEHEAIAATQAAIWHFTNGLQLAPHPSRTPRHLRIDEGRGELLPSTDGRQLWLALPEAGRPARLHAEFDGEPCVESYQLSFSRQPPTDLEVHLECSNDGQHWRALPSSLALPARDGSWRPEGFLVRKGLGPGATVSRSRGGRTAGYRHYRFVLTTGSADRLEVGAPSLNVVPCRDQGVVNSAEMLALYDYLVRGASRAARSQQLLLRAGTMSGSEPAGAHGPFTVNGRLIHSFTPHASQAGRRLAVLDASGRRLQGPLHANDAFYLDPAALGPGPVQLQLQVHEGWRNEGRVLLGGDAAGRRQSTTLGVAVRRAVREQSVQLQLLGGRDLAAPSRKVVGG